MIKKELKETAMSEQKNLRTVELQEKPLKQPQRTRRGEGMGKEEC